MMKLIITWKDKNVANFEVNRGKVENVFKGHGLNCVDIADNVTEILGNGSKKDFSRIWNSIFHLNEHNFFYDVVEKCIWYDDKPLEDIMEECKEDIAKGELIVYD